MVTRQSGEIAKHRGDFVHTLVKFLVGDDGGGFAFRLRDEDEGGFVFVFREMAVDADEPFPEGRMAGVQRLAPGLVPMEEGSVMVETFGKMLLAEFLNESGIDKIRLGDEFLGRMEVLFFLPVDGDLRFS